MLIRKKIKRLRARLAVQAMEVVDMEVTLNLNAEIDF